VFATGSVQIITSYHKTINQKRLSPTGHTNIHFLLLIYKTGYIITISLFCLIFKLLLFTFVY